MWKRMCINTGHLPWLIMRSSKASTPLTSQFWFVGWFPGGPRSIVDDFFLSFSASVYLVHRHLQAVLFNYLKITTDMLCKCSKSWNSGSGVMWKPILVYLLPFDPWDEKSLNIFFVLQTRNKKTSLFRHFLNFFFKWWKNMSVPHQLSSKAHHAGLWRSSTHTVKCTSQKSFSVHWRTKSQPVTKWPEVHCVCP